MTFFNVSIINVRPRAKRVGRYEGMTRAYKKAYVKFAENDSINIFGENND